MKNIIRSSKWKQCDFFRLGVSFFTEVFLKRKITIVKSADPPDRNYKNRNTKARNCTVIFFLLDRALQLDGNIFVWLNYFSTPCWTLDLVGS